MTVLTTTDAIVLKAMKYRDTSRIVTFYTRAFGKLRAIAKGARGPKSKFGSALEPLSRVTLVVYRHEQRELHLISQCDLRATARNLRNDLRRLAAALACLELLDQVAHDSEQNVGLFSLIEQCVARIDTAEVDPEVLLFAFKIRLATYLGFAPALESCGTCGRPVPPEGDESVILDVSRGAVHCLRCGSAEEGRAGGGTAHRRMSGGSLRVLQVLALAPWTEVETLVYTGAIGNEIRDVLRLYLRYHVEDLRPLRSERLLLDE